MYSVPSQLYGTINKYITAVWADKGTTESYCKIRAIQQHTSAQPEET
jgi:hypothetical protein